MKLKEILKHAHGYASDAKDKELVDAIEKFLSDLRDYEKEYYSLKSCEDDSLPEYRSDGQIVDATIELFDIEVERE